MIAQVAISLAIGLTAVATPAPSPATSAPIAAPTAASSPELGGVAIGEDANDALRMFGLHPGTWPCMVDHGMTLCVVDPHYEGVGVALALDTKVRYIAVQGTSDTRSRFADPLGVKLGDPADLLTMLRGKPDASYDDDADLIVRYGPPNALNWRYKIHDTKIVQIELSDGT